LGWQVLGEMSDTFTASTPKRHREFSAGLTAAGGNGSIQVLGWRLHATLVGVAALVVLPLVPVPAVGAAAQGRRLPFGTWVRFDVGAQGSFDSQGVFRFRSDDRVRLRVVDGFCRGDRFRLGGCRAGDADGARQRAVAGLAGDDRAHERAELMLLASQGARAAAERADRDLCRDHDVPGPFVHVNNGS